MDRHVFFLSGSSVLHEGQTIQPRAVESTA
jgi:hypothetical protein